MSNRTPNSRGRHNGTRFILSCLRSVFSELPLHGRWLPAEHLRLYMHMKCQIADDIAFPLSAMMRVINNVLPLSNADPNIMEIAEDSELRVFRYTFQNRTRRYFFWVTANIEVMPSAPSQGNASSWEQDSVLTRLLSRSSGSLERPIVDLTCDTTSTMHTTGTTVQVPEREAKRQKTATDNEDEEVLVRASYDGGWWASGDTRRLFAPCKNVYDKECNVKEIVKEHNLKRYALTGKKDDLGIIDESTSLRHIMGMCFDF